ncbi:cupin domain-containing protein [Microbacterium sp. B2969]|uniref:Cupin domain-containing protein n=1 Tax=Microbacterium alkaliflavum TaxID=3248839 RepID=A0ABW7QDV7_9MICO
MEILPKPATVKNPPEQFTGDVWLDLIAVPREPGQQAVVGRVRFAPGARTAWHSHDRGQTLHIVEGVALVGRRDGTVLVALPGQTVYTSPGEEHWHGATPEDFMEHLAITENGDDPAATTVWLEHVSDEDYRRP